MPRVQKDLEKNQKVRAFCVLICWNRGAMTYFYRFVKGQGRSLSHFNALKVDRGDGFDALLGLKRQGQMGWDLGQNRGEPSGNRDMFGFCSVINRGRSLGTVWTV